MTQQLDSASAARIAALVIREEEGQGKFATFLCKVVLAVWETGSQEPDHHYDAAWMRACDDVATAARKLLVAIKTMKKRGNFFGAFDNLEHELERIVPMTEQLFRRRGRPKRTASKIPHQVSNDLLRTASAETPSPLCAESNLAWTRRGAAPCHALRDGRHLASRKLGASLPPVCLGTVRSCR